MSQSPPHGPSDDHTPSLTRAYTNDGQPILFYAKAMYDYSAEINEEFDLKAGDVIAVTDAPEDGWWRGELVDSETRRQSGQHVFPSNYVSASHTGSLRPRYTDDGQLILFYVKALYDYTAEVDEEFDFKEGDLIAVTYTPEHGWWEGELVDETRRKPGRHIFPSNFVSSPPEKQRPPSPRPTRIYTDEGQRILFYAKALFDYSATIDEEFDFRAGDLIAVTDAPQHGWWNGELVDETRRETGRDVFPCNFVSLL